MYIIERDRLELGKRALTFAVAAWIGLWALQTLNQPQSVVAAPVPPEPIGPPAPLFVAPAPSPQEVLWLARCIYSETKLPHEQELVAWVVRNRVETRYRGRLDYKSVVLDPWQFSAFNRNNPKRAHFTTLHAGSRARGFQDALQIARRVMTADPSKRPFSQRTRHFYSLRSMEDGQAPVWALDVQPVSLDRPVDPRRFQFFDQVV